MNIKKTYSKETTLTAQKVCQLLNDGKVNDLPLNVKQTIGTLTQTTFSNITYITEISAIAIDSNRVLLVASGNSTYYLYSVILTVNNSMITAGDIVQITSDNSQFVKSILVGPNRVMVTFSGCRVAILTIDNTIITLASTNSINSAITSQDSSIVLLDSNHVLFTWYSSTNNYLNAVIITINGISMSSGTTIQITNYYANNPTPIVIDLNRVLLSFTGTNSYLTCVILSISGATISVGTSVQINNVVSSYVSSTLIDSTHALITYTNNNDNYLYSTILTINTTITPGTLIKINSVASNRSTTILIDSTHAVVIYHSYTKTYSIMLTINGSTISASTPILIFAGISQSPVLITPSCIISIGVDSGGVKANSVMITFSKDKALGISQDNTGTVMLKGISKGHTSLTPGSSYYFNGSGVISTDVTGTFVGIAISTTEIYMPNYIIS